MFQKYNKKGDDKMLDLERFYYTAAEVAFLMHTDRKCAKKIIEDLKPLEKSMGLEGPDNKICSYVFFTVSERTFH